MKNPHRYGAFLTAILLAHVAGAADDVRVTRDIEYARVGELSLKLDLYVPATSSPPPVILWVHGGAWRSGSKTNSPLLPLTEKGYALASVDYRLSPVAQFPAQAYDIKGAIRFLRAKHQEYGIAAERMAIAGGSAGGHLAALVGVSGGEKELEGDVGNHLDQSSAVQAIVDFYGPTDLTTILLQSTPHGLSVRVPALQLLLGGQPEKNPALAALASPVAHVDAKDPPLLIFHGDRDPQVPINQSHELVGAYKKHNLPVTLEVVYGGGHGGKGFYTAEQLGEVDKFLRPLLKP
jgi:acetyl esterase/lipase